MTQAHVYEVCRLSLEAQAKPPGSADDSRADTMTKKLRVGVIGAGIAARHLTGFGWNKDLFEVPVLCSLDEDRGRRTLRRRFGIPEYTQDTDELFARNDLDIIDICTPPDTHFELCRQRHRSRQARDLREAALRLHRRCATR